VRLLPTVLLLALAGLLGTVFAVGNDSPALSWEGSSALVLVLLPHLLALALVQRMAHTLAEVVVVGGYTVAVLALFEAADRGLGDAQSAFLVFWIWLAAVACVLLAWAADADDAAAEAGLADRWDASRLRRPH
jgi:hypothetical protein